MVSLDDAVVARWEYGGKRYEVLLDPDMVEAFREDPTSVNLDDFMAVEDVFHDARQGERPAVEDLVSTFGSEDVAEATRTILERGSIQLTTAQRKARVEAMRQRILHPSTAKPWTRAQSRPIREHVWSWRWRKAASP